MIIFFKFTGYVAPSYQSDFTPVDPPKSNSNHNSHHSHDQVTAVNIHHHYHHGGAAQDVDQKYYRKEGDVNGLYLNNNDDDIFKRETVPNSAGRKILNFKRFIYCKVCAPNF